MVRSLPPAWSFSRGHHEWGLCQVAATLPLALLRPGARVVRAAIRARGVVPVVHRFVGGGVEQSRAARVRSVPRPEDRRAHVHGMFMVDPRARTHAEEFSWDTDNIAEMI